MDATTIDLTFAHQPNKNYTFEWIIEFGEVKPGRLEPTAVNRWTDGDTLFIWEKPDQTETDFVFYWSGYKENDQTPLPIWFDLDDGCYFSIGE